MLRPVFSPYGTILEISIMRDRYGKSKGCAWVTYGAKAQAEGAIENLHDKHCIPPQTNPLQVRLAGSPPMRTGPPQAPTPTPVPSTSQQPYAPQSDNTAPVFASNPMQWGSPIHPFTGFAGLGGIQPNSNPPSAQHAQQWGSGAFDDRMGRGDRDTASHRTDHKAGGNNSRGNMCKGGRKLFVGQLSREMREADLKAVMEEFGEVEETVMLRDRAAFVVFAEKESALRALETLRHSATINVRPADGEGEEDECKLFVGMIPYETTEDSLGALFGAHGPLSEVVVLRQNGRSRGAAFVRFLNKESATAAVLALNGRHVLPGSAHPIVVQVASASKKGGKNPQDGSSPRGGGGGPRGGGGASRGRGTMNQSQAGSGGGPHNRGVPVVKPTCGPRGANLFVRNLPTSVTDSELERIFCSLGDVLSATVFRDRTSGCSRGFGFVSYGRVDDATRAVAELDGTIVQGHTIQVQVKSSDLE